MCGIAGFLEPPGTRDPIQDSLVLQAMRDTLIHRGPDDAGQWLDPNISIGLGHRRLAILDLSPLGHQPMSAAAGRYQLVFNGEIYNYRELANELRLAGWSFQGTSDTEVLLAALVSWGVERTLPRLNGMFALAFWDAGSRELWVARDHFGKKPLYYAWLGTTFVFASELKALRQHPAFSGCLSRTGASQYFRYGYIPAPYTIYEGAWKLAPSSFLRITPQGNRVAGSFLPEVAPIDASPDEQGVEQVLRQAVSRRMISDVPLGAFLSGGIDSSLVVALMQESSANPIRTFTLGFAEKTHNEAGFARAVARHLGTHHTEQILHPDEALRMVPEMAGLYDEPFGDPSAIATLLVSRLARTQVIVALSGDGGDEVFAGYNRYLWGPRLWRTLRLLPHPIRRMLSKLLDALPVSRWGGLIKNWVAYPAEKLTKLSQTLACKSAEELYERLISQWGSPDQLVEDGLIPTEPMRGSFLDWMVSRDLKTYLPDDILAKVDRATMAVSLEARAPFLDPQVFWLARRLPGSLKIRGGQGKWVLRRLLQKRLPPHLFERPKAGFSLPIGAWLRRDLRDWASELLEELLAGGLVRPGPVRSRWLQHQREERDWSYPLWSLLMFQSWMRANR